ncbi:MAG TPA: response regulator [Polyangia bacterium]|nr:response regulator [Polyangia bacterium]
MLIVEADGSARRLIGKVVDLEGGEPVLASTGEEAMDLLDSEPFYLLVTAKDLPGINGLELARVARFIRPEMPVILVTDCSVTVDLRLTASLGIVDHIIKPIVVDELCASLRRALRRASTVGSEAILDRIIIEPTRPTGASGPPGEPSGREETKVIRLSSQAPPGRAGKLSVLVVEPDITSRATLTEVFSSLGHDVVAFPSAARAEGQVQHAGFDLLVAGPDTLRSRSQWLREAGGRRPLGAMAIMDGTGIDKVIEAIQLGATGVVAPPFDRDEILADLLIALDQMRKETNADED